MPEDDATLSVLEVSTDVLSSMNETKSGLHNEKQNVRIKRVFISSLFSILFFKCWHLDWVDLFGREFTIT